MAVFGPPQSHGAGHFMGHHSSNLVASLLGRARLLTLTRILLLIHTIELLEVEVLKVKLVARLEGRD